MPLCNPQVVHGCTGRLTTSQTLCHPIRAHTVPYMSSTMTPLPLATGQILLIVLLSLSPTVRPAYSHHSTNIAPPATSIIPSAQPPPLIWLLFARQLTFPTIRPSPSPLSLNLDPSRFLIYAHYLVAPICIACILFVLPSQAHTQFKI
jgi:hypothetical protein